jgi:hypothetical protein
LPHLPAAGPIVRACRLYKTALELIEDRPDITYQLLISATETMAGAVLSHYKPDDAEILRMRRPAQLRELALAYELDEAQANALALKANEYNPWSAPKFKKFITDNVSFEEVDGQDAVFPWGVPSLRPSRENFEKTLSNIYSARSESPWRSGISPLGRRGHKSNYRREHPAYDYGWPWSQRRSSCHLV